MKLEVTPAMRRQLDVLQQQLRRQQQRAGETRRSLSLEQLALERVVSCVKVGAISHQLLITSLSPQLSLKVYAAIPLSGRNIEAFLKLANDACDPEALERGLMFVRQSFKGLRGTLKEERMEAMLGREQLVAMEEEQVLLDTGSHKLKLKGKVLERAEG